MNPEEVEGALFRVLGIAEEEKERAKEAGDAEACARWDALRRTAGEVWKPIAVPIYLGGRVLIKGQ